MDNARRLAVYTRGLRWKTVDGIYRLTPRQRRRTNHKYRKASKAPVAQ